MRAFYIGDFSVDYSTEVYVAYGLDRCGVEVLCCQHNQTDTAETIYEKIRNFSPDFVLFAKSSFTDKYNLLIRKLKKAEVLTVSWNFDLYFDLPDGFSSRRRVSDPTFNCDLIFMTDGGEREGVDKIVLRQGIHEPEAYIGNKLEINQDIVFIGSSSYSKRKELIYFLVKTYGDSFKHYGPGGTMPSVRSKVLNNVIASSKIVIGDSVPSEKYWSNRVYEMIGRGAFFMHPKVDGLEKEFEYYKHFIPFDYGNYAQIKMVIDYYLQRPDEREKIKMAGFRHCKQNYTYTKRCKKLVEEVKKYVVCN